MRRSVKHSVLFGITAAAVALAYLQGPIPQDPSYHDFADQRTAFGVSNFWNVITNVPFVIVGMMGMAQIVRAKRISGGLPGLKMEYFAFFLGVFATGFGSMYYHLAPSNQTLLWDRIPMAIAFGAFFCAVVGEHISIPAGRNIFWPLIALGIGSVLYWYVTERNGSGDLRLYALVQYLPILLVPIIMILYKSNLTPAAYLWTACGAYAAAKFAESLDKSIYGAGYILSGHSVKHLAAAYGAFAFAIALRRRKTAERNAPVPTSLI